MTNTPLKALVAFVVGLATVMVPAPATAEPAPSAPSAARAVALTPDCVQKISRLPRTGGTATVDCRRSDTAAKTDGVGTLQSCGSGGNWAYTRRSVCSNGSGTAFIVQRPSLEIIGAIDYSVTSQVIVNGRSDRWSHTLSYRGISAWGAVGGVTISARAECGLACSMVGYGFEGGSALPGHVAGGSATLASTFHGINAIWHASSQWTWWFTSPITTPPDSNPTTWRAPEHRCDDTLGPSTSAGCTFPQVQPTHEIGRTRYPKYARHIELAINHAVPSVLTRTTDPGLVALNRAISCPEGPSYPRPEGHSCDEYPFASTREGAASQGFGRTFTIFNWLTGHPPFICSVPWLPPRRGEMGGYSVCMVPVAENSGGGTDLGLFYYDNRVIDGDRFAVLVV